MTGNAEQSSPSATADHQNAILRASTPAATNMQNRATVGTLRITVHAENVGTTDLSTTGSVRFQRKGVS